MSQSARLIQTLKLEPAFIKSIQTFQLGEESEGKCLLALAEAYAHQHNQPEYLAAIQQFIGEEQRHAGFLSQTLKGFLMPAYPGWNETLFLHLSR